MRKISIPRNWSSVTLGKGTSLDDGVVLLAAEPGEERIVIKGSYLNRYTILDAHLRIEIRLGCMIGPHCFITDSDHGAEGESSVADQPMISKAVLIEKDVWIGANVSILKGVTIGQGAIVAAGSVVTKSVDPRTVVAGVPAKFLRSRK